VGGRGGRVICMAIRERSETEFPTGTITSRLQRGPVPRPAETWQTGSRVCANDGTKGVVLASHSTVSITSRHPSAHTHTHTHTFTLVVHNAHVMKIYAIPCSDINHRFKIIRDRLCGLVVRVLGYRSGGPGSIPGTTRKKRSGSGTGYTQPREYN
jgi:hypothetical protein